MLVREVVRVFASWKIATLRRPLCGRDDSPRCGVVRHGRRIHGLLHRGRRVREVTEAGRLLANFGHFLFTSGSQFCSQGSTAMHFLRHVVHFLFVSFLLPRLLPPRILRSVPSLGPHPSRTTCSQPSVTHEHLSTVDGAGVLCIVLFVLLPFQSFQFTGCHFRPHVHFFPGVQEVQLAFWLPPFTLLISELMSLSCV